MTPRFTIPSALAFLLLWGSSLSVSAADWPHWLGQHRNGHTAEDSGWAAGGWPMTEPTWQARVGQGCSSLLAVGDHLWTVGWEGNKDHVRCLDAATGKPLWSVSYACPLHGRFHKG